MKPFWLILCYRAYYARPTSSTSIKSQPHNRPSTSAESPTLNLFRTRNRPTNPAQRRSSRRIFSSKPGELDLAEVRGSPRRRASPSWSPHLWHDRTSLGRRRTLFQAPSLDESAEGTALSKRNAQILLFATGFIFPISWFIASFLPLPRRPSAPAAKGKNAPRQAQIAEDLEKQLGPTDEARYENARWWRNINRIMSIVGVLIIVAVVSPPKPPPPPLHIPAPANVWTVLLANDCVTDRLSCDCYAMRSDTMGLLCRPRFSKFYIRRHI